MWKLILISSIFTLAYAGIIHDHSHEQLEAETDHHHKVDHEHATSHQSFKFHHFHAVPVYVKHEDQHLLKNPIELGGVKHKLKVLHPKSEHHHGGHGLTLENHTEEKDHHDHHAGGYEYGGAESNQQQQYRTVENDDLGAQGHELSRHQFQDINVQHGHSEGGPEYN